MAPAALNQRLLFFKIPYLDGLRGVPRILFAAAAAAWSLTGGYRTIGRMKTLIEWPFLHRF
jgi:hypothetical protein